MRATLHLLTIATVAAFLLPFAQPTARAADTPSSPAAQTTAPPVAGGKRVALVIGNQSYPETPLSKPGADARAVADTLRKIGFDVTTVLNAGGEDLQRAVEAAATRASDADISVLYYSGLAMSNDGAEYLVPVDLNGSEDALSMSYKAMALGYALHRLRPQSGAQLTFLDAGFTNPWLKGKGAGLTPPAMAAHPGSFVFHASTAIALEGSPAEPLSTFTSYLVPALLTPGVEVAQAMAPVVGAVARATKGRQVPVFHYGLTAPVHLVPVE